MEVEEEVVEQEKETDLVWEIALGVLCIAIFAYGMYSLDPESVNLKESMVSKFPVALVLWLFFYLPISRRNKGHVTLLTFIALFTALIGPELLVHFDLYQSAMGIFRS